MEALYKDTIFMLAHKAGGKITFKDNLYDTTFKIHFDENLNKIIGYDTYIINLLKELEAEKEDYFIKVNLRDYFLRNLRIYQKYFSMQGRGTPKKIEDLIINIAPLLFTKYYGDELYKALCQKLKYYNFFHKKRTRSKTLEGEYSWFIV